MPTHKGLGIAWSSKIDSVTYTAAATALSVTHQEQSFSKSAEKVEHTDGNGETVGLTFFNAKNELSLRCYPSGATIAAAKTANVLPAIGDKLTVAWTSSPAHEDTDLAGDYIVEGCSKTRRVGEKVEFDISVVKYSTDLSTTVPAS